MEDKDRKGDSDLMVIDSMEGGGEISGNNGESLKHLERRITYSDGCLIRKITDWRQHFRSKLEATRRPAVRLF